MPTLGFRKHLALGLGVAIWLVQYFVNPNVWIYLRLFFYNFATILGYAF